jgi:hypothetical protein
VDAATFQTDAGGQQSGSPLLRAYANRTLCNGQLLEVVSTVLAKSSPVIIIQGMRLGGCNARGQAVDPERIPPDRDYTALYQPSPRWATSGLS